MNFRGLFIPPIFVPSKFLLILHFVRRCQSSEVLGVQKKSFPNMESNYTEQIFS